MQNITYIVLTSYFLPGQTGAWENHTRLVWVKRSKAGIASLLTPPQSQCEAGREKHTTCRQNDWKEEDRGSERGRYSERGEWRRDRRYIWLCGCVKCQGMHHNCVFFLELPDESVQDIITLLKWVIFLLWNSRSCVHRGQHFQRRNGKRFVSDATRISLTFNEVIIRTKICKLVEGMYAGKWGWHFTVSNQDFKSRIYLRWVMVEKSNHSDAVCVSVFSEFCMCIT